MTESVDSRVLARLSPAGLAFHHGILSGRPYAVPPHVSLLDGLIVSAAVGELQAQGYRGLIATTPPRHGKSELFSRFAPAWYLGAFPRRSVVLASYEADFAMSWGRKAREVLELCGPEVFGVRVDRRSSAASSWRVLPSSAKRAGEHGEMHTAGIGGAITGRGADLLIIDDPVKNAAEAHSRTRRDSQWTWLTSTALTRLEPGGFVLLVMCMTGDTPVLRPNGATTPLRELRPGDEVATYEDGALSVSTVRRWANQGPDTVYLLRMRSGAEVRANARHPFLVVGVSGDKTWRQLKDLKPEDMVVRAMRRGGVCEESGVLLRDAIHRQSARECACPTTGERDGRLDTDLRPPTRNLGGRGDSSIATESPLMSTTAFSKNKKAGARYAGDFPKKLGNQSIGRTSSASITTTIRAPCEDCCVTTAISSLPEDTRREFCASPLDIWSIGEDEVLAITEDGITDVFDIQVDRTENFIANGLVAHNTRWHEDDVAGRLLESMADGGDQYLAVNLPAISDGDADPIGRLEGEPLWPERWSLAELESRRRALGSYVWGALYQGKPTDASSGMFDTDWLRIVDAPRADAKRSARVWDFASTEGAGDYTAGVLVQRLGDSSFLVADVRRGRWSADGVDAAVLDCAALDGRSTKIRILQERGAAGRLVVQRFKRLLPGHDVKGLLETGEKEVRARPMSAAAERGDLELLRARWTDAFIEEAVRFPRGVYDDQVDAAAAGVAELEKVSSMQVL